MACMKELYLTLNVQTFGGNFLLSTKYVHFKGKLEQVVFSNIYWTPPTGWIHAEVGRYKQVDFSAKSYIAGSLTGPNHNIIQCRSCTKIHQATFILCMYLKVGSTDTGTFHIQGTTEQKRMNSKDGNK